MFADLILAHPVLAPSIAALLAIFVAMLLLELLPLVGGRRGEDEAVFPRN